MDIEHILDAHIRLGCWPRLLIRIALLHELTAQAPKAANAPVLVNWFTFDSTFWTPTLSLSLDIKKPLPQEGEEWLRIRITAKVVKNGRYDAEVIVFDNEGDVVALGNHLALVLG